MQNEKITRVDVQIYTGSFSFIYSTFVFASDESGDDPASNDDARLVQHCATRSAEWAFRGNFRIETQYVEPALELRKNMAE